MWGFGVGIFTQLSRRKHNNIVEKGNITSFPITLKLKEKNSSALISAYIMCK